MSGRREWQGRMALLSIWMSLLAAPAARGATQLEIPYRRIPQIAGQLCWAATAQSILEHAGVKVSQVEMAESLLQTAHDTNMNVCPYPPLPSPINCQTIGPSSAPMFNQYCDCPGDPGIPLTTFVPKLKGAAGYYSWQLDAAKDFDELKKRLDLGPLAYGLHYPSGGNHFLLAVGYSDGGTADTQMVSIYDPWNGGDYLAPPDPTETHHDDQTLKPFAAYFGSSDMGLTTLHLSDYGLEEVSRVPPEEFLTKSQPHVPTEKLLTEWRPPTNDPIQSGPAVPLDRSILESNPFALTAVTHYASLHVRADGGNGSELRLGPALPIVPVGITDLIRAGRSPARELLRPDTDRILYPVEQDGVVVDAFILTRVGDRWVEGGYANTAIVRQLVELRARMGRACDADTCYLVSIPGLRVFLLARRTGTSATLVSAYDSVHVRIGAAQSDVLKAGVSYRASGLMNALQSAARAQQPVRTAQAR